MIKFKSAIQYLDERPICFPEIIITEHAYDRAKDRLSLTRKAFYKLAETAYLTGIRHKDTKGRMNKYITSIWFQYQNADNVRIYGENVFLFKQNVLITVYQLPNHLKHYLKLFK